MSRTNANKKKENNIMKEKKNNTSKVKPKSFKMTLKTILKDRNAANLKI